MLWEIAEIQAPTKHLSNALEKEYLVTVRNYENGEAKLHTQKDEDASWKYPGFLQLSTQKDEDARWTYPGSLQLSTHKGLNKHYTPADNKSFTKGDSIQIVKSTIPH